MRSVEKSGTRAVFESIRDKVLESPRRYEDLIFEVSKELKISMVTVREMLVRMEKDGKIIQSGAFMEEVNFEAEA